MYVYLLWFAPFGFDHHELLGVYQTLEGAEQAATLVKDGPPQEAVRDPGRENDARPRFWAHKVGPSFAFPIRVRDVWWIAREELRP